MAIYLLVIIAVIGGYYAGRYDMDRKWRKVYGEQLQNVEARITAAMQHAERMEWNCDRMRQKLARVMKEKG